MSAKPYQAKSLSGAQAEVRRLRKQLIEAHDLLDRYHDQRRTLARLAADGPAFFNPLQVAAAKRLRDKILRWDGMNPDGSFRERP